MKPKPTDFIDSKTLATFKEIDGLAVIEECLLFKGVGVCDSSRTVAARHLEHAAHLLYGLKVNPTNKMYVAHYLHLFLMRQGLVKPDGRVLVPKDIFERVDKLNKSYQTRNNQE